MVCWLYDVTVSVCLSWNSVSQNPLPCVVLSLSWSKKETWTKHVLGETDAETPVTTSNFIFALYFPALSSAPSPPPTPALLTKGNPGPRTGYRDSGPHHQLSTVIPFHWLGMPGFLGPGKLQLSIHTDALGGLVRGFSLNLQLSSPDLYLSAPPTVLSDLIPVIKTYSKYSPSSSLMGLSLIHMKIMVYSVCRLMIIFPVLNIVLNTDTSCLNTWYPCLPPPPSF